jgi:hypothetical protein
VGESPAKVLFIVWGDGEDPGLVVGAEDGEAGDRAGYGDAQEAESGVRHSRGREHLGDEADEALPGWYRFDGCTHIHSVDIEQLDRRVDIIISGIDQGEAGEVGGAGSDAGEEHRVEQICGQGQVGAVAEEGGSGDVDAAAEDFHIALPDFVGRKFAEEFWVVNEDSAAAGEWERAGVAQWEAVIGEEPEAEGYGLTESRLMMLDLV